MDDDIPVREQLKDLLEWGDAHVTFEAVTDDIPRELRGKQPHGLPYSPWQLVEHIRRAQWDILDFCRNANYQELKWPDDYWPPTVAPPSPEAWDESIEQFKVDRRELQDLALTPRIVLTSKIPHGKGQTYLREIVLVADHTAYHIGQLVAVRRLLGIWKPK
ncbi:MAG TPA: DinB family protein [Vicinamibacterales bacterium]|jgi:uncharacterized damage-inducible protein DinB